MKEMDLGICGLPLLFCNNLVTFDAKMMQTTEWNTWIEWINGH